MRVKEVDLLLKMLYGHQLCPFIPKDCKEKKCLKYCKYQSTKRFYPLFQFNC